MVTSSRQLLLIFVVAVLLVTIPYALFGELPGLEWLSRFEENPLWLGICGSALLAADSWLAVPSSIVIILITAKTGFIYGWICSYLGVISQTTIAQTPSFQLFSYHKPHLRYNANSRNQISV